MHRSWIIMLAGLVASTASLANVRVFDPREQKMAIAGAPSQVLVLGTLHLPTFARSFWGRSSTGSPHSSPN